MTTVRILNICLVVAMGLLLGSCAVTDVSHDVDFNQYRTFGFSTAEVHVSNPAYKSNLITSNIRKNIRSEFEKHGLKYAKKNPDLLVSYETFTQEKEQMSANYGAYPFMFPGMYYRGFPYMWGYPYMPYGMYGPGGRVYYYTEGTLIIDVTDANTKEQVWRGLVKGNVSDLNALQKSIDKGVKAIMKKYPGKVNPTTDTIEAPPKKRVS
jgi:hypothetical protein